jgi:hypothetical protein
MAAIYLCSLIILKIILRQGSVEVRLSKPGLHTDDHIETLNGKHIVLVIQSIASHQEDAVCVNLCRKAQTKHKKNYGEELLQ